jgi:AI-2 transport protein TqsA
VLGPLLVAIFFAILCQPIYARLRRRGVGAALALTLVALLLLAATLLLAGIVALSVGQLLANVSAYQDELAQRFGETRDRLAAAGIVPGGAPTGDDVAAPLAGLLRTVAGAVAGLALNLFYLLLIVLFLLADGPRLIGRAAARLGPEHPLLGRTTRLAPDMVRYFGLRTYLNALTGLGVGIVLWLLGIDYAALWGVLLFFLSYVPYIGIFLASAPPVVLALAEYGFGRAVLVAVLITVVNLSLENIVMPRIVGRGLSLSPLVVFLSFFFWTWLIGPAGALLSVFLTLLVITVLDSYEETRWLAEAMVSPAGG